MSTTRNTSNGPITGFITSLDRRTVVFAFGVYFVVLFATVMPPFFSFFNRMEPFVFGLSFVLFWVFLVSVLIALGLATLYWVEAKRGELV
ncbi:hypothetical protein [Halopenitus persicus]|uniref:hypothetical protein n=1 Tax=Halopenitus persicus TaxID=1048396 RepID=UPI000BBAE662|nr:hypothetical protein [Halopenitus persicus]